jgi:excisionase family DNA binding protein
MSARNREETPAADERLLTTREAATFLKVSEASIRRWTDSGILPASRVGRRRARRLRETDLRIFLQAGQGQHAGTVGASPPSTMTIQDVEVPLGSHLATFYTTDAGRLRLGLPLLRDGLLAGHTVLLRAIREVREFYFAALRDEGIDVAEAIRGGQFMLFPEVPGPASEQVARIEALLTAAARKRPGPIRVLAEVLANVRTVGSLSEHLSVERQVGPLFKRFSVVVLCAYDVRAFDGVTVIEALKQHPDIFGNQVGYWLS